MEPWQHVWAGLLPIGSRKRGNYSIGLNYRIQSVCGGRSNRSERAPCDWDGYFDLGYHLGLQSRLKPLFRRFVDDFFKLYISQPVDLKQSISRIADF